MTGIVMVRYGLAARDIVQDAFTEYFHRPGTERLSTTHFVYAGVTHPVKEEVKEWGIDLDNPMTFEQFYGSKPFKGG